MHDELFWFVLIRIVNVRWQSSLFRITSVHVSIVLIRSQHTLCDTPNYMIVAWSGLMFADPFHIRYLDNFSKYLIMLERSFMLTFPMAYLAFLYFFVLALVLRARAVTNPFPDLPNFPYDSEDVVSILFRLSNFSGIFKVKILSLTLISLCFITLRRPQLFMFTDWSKYFLPVNFSSQNVFWVEQPW